MRLAASPLRAQIDAEDRQTRPQTPGLAVANVTSAGLLVETGGVPLGLPVHSARAEPPRALSGMLEKARAPTLPIHSGAIHRSSSQQTSPLGISATSRRLAPPPQRPRTPSRVTARTRDRAPTPPRDAIWLVAPVAVRCLRDRAKSLPFVVMTGTEPHRCRRSSCFTPKAAVQFPSTPALHRTLTTRGVRKGEEPAAR